VSPAANMLDTLILKNKNVGAGGKGKELDPKHFDDSEWEAFAGEDGADSAQWEAHIKNGAVRVLSAEESASVPPERILPIPSRFVRTNKAKDAENLKAKSRWIVPGHLAPKSDGTRTDAPVAPQLCLHLLFSLAVQLDWQVATFDVGDAFLTGMETMNRLYVRPPREGIRGVPQNTLIELVKGVFGLKESPRLWWLKLRQTLVDLGWEELTFATATFVLREDDGKLCGMLVVHVDDGIWAGHGKKFLEAQSALRKKINIKTEQANNFTVLGREVKQTPDMIEVSQEKYVRGIKPVYIPAVRRRQPDAPLLAQEQTAYNSLVAQLAWPARSTLPGLCFDVSDLQQRSRSAKISDLVRCNTVLRYAQTMVQRGVCLRFKKFDIENLEKLAVGIVHDASFGNQPGEGSQQGYLTMISTEGLFHGKAPVHLVDWSSSKIHRVVRSTLAAEGASAAHAYDRGCHARVILAEVLSGRTAAWPEMVSSIPSCLGTDCRSLHDHCNKTGSSVAEKRIAMDIADVRAGIDRGDAMTWLPTEWMAADGLTKHLTEQVPLETIMMEGWYAFSDGVAPGLGVNSPDPGKHAFGTTPNTPSQERTGA